MSALMLTREELVEVVFVSGLHPDACPTVRQVHDAILTTLAHHDVAYCLSAMADEYGDHPAEAASRSHWVNHLIDGLPDDLDLRVLTP